MIASVLFGCALIGVAASEAKRLGLAQLTKFCELGILSPN